MLRTEQSFEIFPKHNEYGFVYMVLDTEVFLCH